MRDHQEASRGAGRQSHGLRAFREAEGNPLAKGNPYVGPQKIGDGVFGPMLAAIDNAPHDMIRLGRYKKLLKFVLDAQEANTSK
jgi:hypothetical protein